MILEAGSFKIGWPRLAKALCCYNSWQKAEGHAEEGECKGGLTFATFLTGKAEHTHMQKALIHSQELHLHNPNASH
jgi:hypothetical protein